METIKVNMNPNPLDVQTIHASQNDGEARQWGFELHNNGELIDTSDVKEQLVFKAYKGGTEQLLPENGSTPTTSPIIADIKYPQGLLTDQEFTYRQSPTEEDGLAKITDIKGNTLVWNQLVDISVVPSSVINGITYERQAEEIKATGTASADSTLFISGSNYNIYNFINGHSYYLKGCPSGGLLSTYYMSWSLPGNDYGNGRIAKATSNLTGYIYARIISGVTVNNLSFKPQLFDLTSMGIDDLTTPTQVEEWLSTHIGLLPYYSYNQGTLLSFMGNGIKTVGFNQWDEEWELGTYLNTNGSKYNSTSKIRNVNPIRVLPNTTYYYMVGTTSTDEDGVFFYDGNMTFIRRQPVSHGSSISTSFTTPANCSYVNFSVKNTTYNNDICVNISDTSKNGTYEPYTSSTLSLPISTYFPTGMKSAGSVYDELTPTKAITRIGAVDLGSLTWQYYPARNNFYAVIPDIAVPTNANTKANAKCILGVPITWNEMLANQNESGTYAVTQVDTEKRFYIKNTNYSSVTDFMTFINGVYLYYELATPTETSFTTASLVTENAEIPLSNEDGVLIGKCTEELSAEPGFHDAKIKLSDSDGTCYSNKIQLHIERSPQ